MMNYIKSELYRLSHKKSSYIYFAVMFGLFLLLMSLANITSVAGFNEGVLQIIRVLLVFVFGIHVFQAVYTDELSARILPTTISTGLSRVQLILAKLVVSIVYLLAIYVVCAVFYSIIAIFYAKGLNADFFNGISDLVPYVVFSFINNIVFLLIGSIIAYATQKSVLAITIFVVMVTGILSQIVALVGMIIPFFLDVYEYLPTSQYNSLVTTFSVNSSISIENLLILSLYAIVSLVLSYLVLSRSEIKGD